MCNSAKCTIFLIYRHIKPSYSSFSHAWTWSTCCNLVKVELGIIISTAYTITQLVQQFVRTCKICQRERRERSLVGHRSKLQKGENTSAHLCTSLLHHNSSKMTAVCFFRSWINKARWLTLSKALDSSTEHKSAVYPWERDKPINDVFNTTAALTFSETKLHGYRQTIKSIQTFLECNTQTLLIQLSW